MGVQWVLILERCPSCKCYIKIELVVGLGALHQIRDAPDLLCFVQRGSNPPRCRPRSAALTLLGSALQKARHFPLHTTSSAPQGPISPGGALHGMDRKSCTISCSCWQPFLPRLERAQTLSSHLNPDTNIAEAKRTAANCLRSVVESPPRRLTRHLSGEGPFWLGNDICASCFGCLVCGTAGDLAVVFGGLWWSVHVPPRPLQDQVAVGSGNGRALLQAASRRAHTISAVRGAEQSMSCTCKTTRAWGSQVLPLRTVDL